MTWNSLKILYLVSLLLSVLLLPTSPTMQISFLHMVENMVVTALFFLLLYQAPERASLHVFLVLSSPNLHKALLNLGLALTTGTISNVHRPKIMSMHWGSQ